MVAGEDVGRTVVIRAADEFYEFINGWAGILAGFESGYGVVNVADESVDGGFKQFLVPPEQLELKA